MPRLALQTLTWATITAAISSALWLASANLGLADLRKGADLGSVSLPKEPTAAGLPSQAASSDVRNASVMQPDGRPAAASGR